ncbi:flagellar basal-body rod protein FlgG [Phenylobacterium aquaticum]|uniref:flagellar basal-body rod protein FlgG n=1 Tax=Phenylobacterium aquaticum TaxID=1763816 RepID=UPI0026F339E6|nr:flagellar basal-body rod protein FlgG [Phenylobacterium aquaticum]
MQALRTAATGMAAQQLNVEVISNNIANMNTVGFKRQRAEFQDLLYQTMERAGAQSSDQGTVVPTGIQIGAGVKTGSVYRITEQGAMTATGNDLDMAIDGRGYFQVLMPSGDIAFSRAGNLSVNGDGQLVTNEGYQIQPAITIPSDATKVSISKTGQVEVSQPGSTTPSVIGNLELANFINQAGLEAIGSNLFLQSGSSGAPTTGAPGSAGFGTVLQGYTEASNVDAVTEITALITAQRAYEMNSKVITSSDQMLATANQLKG